jgi:hypothetical protein
VGYRVGCRLRRCAGERCGAQGSLARRQARSPGASDEPSHHEAGPAIHAAVRHLGASNNGRRTPARTPPVWRRVRGRVHGKRFPRDQMCNNVSRRAHSRSRHTAVTGSTLLFLPALRQVSLSGKAQLQVRSGECAALDRSIDARASCLPARRTGLISEVLFQCASRAAHHFLRIPRCFRAHLKGRSFAVRRFVRPALPDISAGRNSATVWAPGQSPMESEQGVEVQPLGLR